MAASWKEDLVISVAGSVLAATIVTVVIIGLNKKFSGNPAVSAITQAAGNELTQVGTVTGKVA